LLLVNFMPPPPPPPRTVDFDAAGMPSSGSAPNKQFDADIQHAAAEETTKSRLLECHSVMRHGKVPNDRVACVVIVGKRRRRVIQQKRKSDPAKAKVLSSKGERAIRPHRC